MKPNRAKNWQFLVSASLLILTSFLMYAYYNRWFSFAARIGPFRIIHYLAFAGTLYIAFEVILFAALKRRNSNPEKYKLLLKTHVFGNLASFLLISMHFAGQVGRPADFYPTFGTGLALYIGMVALVATGFILRFQVFRRFNPVTNRFVHSGLAFAFYLIIGIHVLHGLNII